MIRVELLNTEEYARILEWKDGPVYLRNTLCVGSSSYVIKDNDETVVSFTGFPSNGFQILSSITKEGYKPRYSLLKILKDLIPLVNREFKPMLAEVLEDNRLVMFLGFNYLTEVGSINIYMKEVI